MDLSVNTEINPGLSVGAVKPMEVNFYFHSFIIVRGKCKRCIVARA